MRQTNSIEKFMIGMAHYHVSNNHGDKAILQVDYQNNTYVINGDSLSPLFLQEASDIAQDLLDRKHGVNFAKPLASSSPTQQ